MSDLTTQDFQILREKAERNYKINGGVWIGRMRKSGCSKEYIYAALQILAESKDYDPWKFMGGKIRMNKIDLQEAEVKKAHKDSMDSLKSVLEMIKQ